MQRDVAVSAPHGRNTHCRLSPGENLGSFTVTKVLGKGRFSTVWAAGGAIAIKVYRSGFDNERYYANEVKILSLVTQHAVYCPHIIGYRGTFAHVSFGHGIPRIHPCIVFDNGGDSLATLVRFCKTQYDKGLPSPVAKSIMRNILTGLAYLHDQCGIVHTDIKPDNILLNGRVEDLDDSVVASIADLGSSTTTDDVFSNHVGTAQYLAPELIIGKPYDASIDVWAAFTVFYEMMTGDLLFDLYDECDIIYSAKGIAVNDVIMDDITSVQTGDDVASSNEAPPPDLDESDDTNEDSSSGYDAADHIFLITRLLGHPPSKFARQARGYYNRRNRLKNKPNVTPISIYELLLLNYDIPDDECVLIADFLLLGLTYMPASRITASKALSATFIN